jgi:integrase
MRINGVQHQKTFKSKDEALLWLARLEQKKALGEEVKRPKKITFAEFAAEWLREYASAKVSPRTYEGYKASLDNHLLPHFGALYLTQITRRKINEFLADWNRGGPFYQERLRAAEEPQARKAREQRRPPRAIRLGRSQGTMKNAMVVLREMLGHAATEDFDNYLTVNPAAGLGPLPKPPHDEYREEEVIRVLSGEQVERLLDAAPANYRTLVLTAVSTGVRLGELRALRWGDVEWDREKPRLCVRRSVTKNGVFQVPKTKGSTRKIPIGARLRTALLEHRMSSRYKDESDLIFPNGKGAPLDGHNLAVREFKPALRRAGLPSIRFHDLRHTFATLLLERRVPVTVVSKMLGHASAKMTLDTYSHLLPDSLDEAADEMEAAIFGAHAAVAEQA